MKGLTVLTVLVIPYNVVAGFFGMNVKVPMSADDLDTVLPFFLLLLGSTISALLLYIGLKRLKWL
jgi:Mg2+ and Co2+ transporter CorA